MTAFVVAYDQQRGIGDAKNDMPWQRNLPGDLARFKKLTTGKSIIMGRKTFESIGSKPLPHRQNIVLSRKATGIEGVLTAASLEAALALAQYEPYIIGGGHVFREALPFVDTIYATEIQHSFPEATVFFPTLPSSEWYEASRESRSTDDRNHYAYDFVRYERVAPSQDN